LAKGVRQQSTGVQLIAVLGGVLPFVSAIVAAPLVVETIERLSGGASLAWRLAGRSLGRNRARSASVVAALCAVAGLAVALPTYLASLPTGSPGTPHGPLNIPFVPQNQVELISSPSPVPNDSGYPDASHTAPPTQPVPESQAATVRAVLPTARRVDISTVRGPDGDLPRWQLDRTIGQGYMTFDYGSAPTLGVATPELLDLYSVNAAERARLSNGNALIVVPPGAPASVPTRTQPSEPVVLHVGGRVVTDDVSYALPRVLIGAGVAAQNHWTVVPSGVTVFAAAHRFTDVTRRRLRLIDLDIQFAQSYAAAPPPGSVSYSTSTFVGEPPLPAVAPAITNTATVLAAGVLMLAVVAIGLALAARDSRDEGAVLDALGASPRSRRKVGTRRAVLLVAAACVLAVPAGLVPVAGMVLGSTRRDAAFRVDWLALAAVVIVLPALIGSANALGAWARDRVRRTVPDVLVFAD
jgi:putative ABC transport system permease protein